MHDSVWMYAGVTRDCDMPYPSSAKHCVTHKIDVAQGTDHEWHEPYETKKQERPIQFSTCQDSSDFSHPRWKWCLLKTFSHLWVSIFSEVWHNQAVWKPSSACSGLVPDISKNYAVIQSAFATSFWVWNTSLNLVNSILLYVKSIPWWCFQMH